MDHAAFVQQIRRYGRDRVRELEMSLKLNYARPKMCLIIGTQLEEAARFQEAIEQLLHDKGGA